MPLANRAIRPALARLTGTDGRQAGVDLESHRVGTRIDEAHLRIDALPTGKVGRVGHGARHIKARCDIARRNAISETILQSDPQHRQGLGLAPCVLDARAHGDEPGSRRICGCAKLPHIVGAQVPVRHELHTERAVERGQRAAEARVDGELVAIVIHDLCQQHEQRECGESTPGAGTEPRQRNLVDPASHCDCGCFG